MSETKGLTLLFATTRRNPVNDKTVTNVVIVVLRVMEFVTIGTI
jgi:hypothetical protein